VKLKNCKEMSVGYVNILSWYISGGIYK